MTAIFYWGTYLFVILAQAFYTFSSMNQIRLEEVIESFRSVWWFQNHLVWNGGYSSLGWAFIQAFVVNLFGFNFYNAKFIKLAIEIVGYFCLAKILKRYLGSTKAIVPLLIIGFSPTLLYFNSLQLSVGTEVSFFIICLYILTTIDFKKKKEAMLKQGLLWGIAMFAWLTYFGFAFYLPILGSYYLYLLLRQKRPKFHNIIKNLTISFIIFIIPLIAMLFYVKNRELLIYDPLLHRGLFRSFAEVSIKPDVWIDTFQRLTKDLFFRPSSYYFESKKVEFSDYYPIVSIITVAGVLFVTFKKKKRLRPLILSLAFFLLVYFILISLIGPKTLGGMRRGSVILVLFYFLFTIAWQFVLNQNKQTLLRYALIGGMSLLLMHHLIVYPINIENIKKPSVFREKWWFNSGHPDKTLSDLVSAVTKTDVIIPCWHTQNQSKSCAGLSLIYPSIALACKHSHLKCNKLYSYDYDSKKTTLLNINYWGQQTHTEP